MAPIGPDDPVPNSTPGPARPDWGGAGEVVGLDDGREVLVRRLRRSDGALYPAFLARISPRDRRLRFFTASRPTAQLIGRLTDYDPAAARALAALEGEPPVLAAVARLHRVEDGSGEFAVLVRSDLQGLGLGRELLRRVLSEGGAIAVGAVRGHILRENRGMISLARDLGFSVAPDPQDGGLLVARLDP